MNKKIWIGLGIFFVMVVTSIIGFWIHLTYLGKWYDQVWAEMPSIDQKMISLNHAALAQIPIPAGVIMTEQQEWGVDSIHTSYGVDTHISYMIIDPKLDVQLYYRNLMNQLGWVLISSSPGDLIVETIYNKKTTCMRVTTYPSENKVYDIEVYQDFLKQDFSPKLPPEWYIEFRQYGQNNIEQCP